MGFFVALDIAPHEYAKLCAPLRHPAKIPLPGLPLAIDAKPTVGHYYSALVVHRLYSPAGLATRLLQLITHRLL